MKLSELLIDFEISEYSKGLDPDISGIAYDSRQVDHGYLFVAVEGFQTDGHLFINDAVKKGAVAVVVKKPVSVPEGVARVVISDTREGLAIISSRYYNFPCEKLNIVGVTGTNGKTTTTHMLKKVYEAANKKTGLIGTLYNMVGEKVLPVEHTTPESLDLQKILSDMVNENVQSLVMEVSSHALALDRVKGCEFDVAVFTNITQDHLDFHKDMEEYLEAKKKLFINAETSVINIDNYYGPDILESAQGKIVTYGLSNDAAIYAENLRISPSRASFTLVGAPEKNVEVNLQLTGKFNVYNALAAFAVGIAEGFEIEVIKNAIENVKGVPGRFELVERGQNFAVIVDYAHSPDGLENILLTAREITEGRLISVFGCGGDRDRTKRPLMGKIGVKISDLAIITSDNPRSEEPENIISDILEGVNKINEADYTVIIDRREAIRHAILSARAGDVVIIAGKGHETEQEIKGQKIHFDDREEAKKVLDELGGVGI